MLHEYRVYHDYHTACIIHIMKQAFSARKELRLKRPTKIHNNLKQSGSLLKVREISVMEFISGKK